MPSYIDRTGQQYDLADWPGVSYKARVINAAYASGMFEVHNIGGDNIVFFRCFWCGKPVPSAGVEGDHVVPQSLGASNDKELRRLFKEAEKAENPDGTNWNLVLSCSECNGGSRNKQKMYTRSQFKEDRDRQGPIIVV